MTKPIFEPTEERRMASMGFTDQQLLRRPATATPDEGASTVVIQLKITNDDVVVVAADGQMFLAITEDMDGMYLVDCAAWVSTVSSSGLITVQLRNSTQSVDMLSTPITIDSGETNSKDAATPVVINAGNSQVDWADFIRVDVDSAGTLARGLGVDLFFDVLGT